MRLLLILAATLILFLALALAYPDVMIKPGKLSEGHRSLERDCFGCHAPIRGASSVSCLSCHKLEGIGRVTTAGAPLPAERFRKLRFHAGLGGTDCMRCHNLHASVRHRKTATFEHELLAAEFRRECQTCHLEQKPADELHSRLNDRCGSCHATAAWKPATFEHDRYFRFDANHPATCRTCHTDQGTFSTYTCYGCHEHSRAGILAEHREEGIRNIENCARCHRSGNEDEAEGGEGGGEGESHEDED
ncbi:MAG TPA: class III cytochrome C family protein [Thermoanaerobaculia bacterium]|nr:class III cytochrome C family protein [Thermoanaerobaculia bacterium]